MTLVKYTHKSYELPSEGVHRSTLAEIKELGTVLTPGGEKKERVRFIWELEEAGRDGLPLKVFQTFNLSLHPKSFLSQAIHDITGRDPGEQFELDELLGSQVNLVLKHNQSESDGRTYCNVAAILRPATKAESAEAQRVAQATAKIKQSPAVPAGEITDDDIPF